MQLKKIYMPEAQVKAISKRAKKLGVSFSAYVRMIMAGAME